MDTNLTFNLIESNGSIDMEASRADLLAKFEALMTDRATYVHRIADAVNAVFDREDTRINLPHVVSLTIAEMKISAKEYGKWEARVLDYVRSNSKGDDSLFDIGKGTKNGGVARKVKPAPTSETVSVPTEVAPSSEMSAAAE